MSLYPLKFRPLFLEKMWGGRKIETVLGKALPADQMIGESWELYDLPPGAVDWSKDWVSSEIANGPLAGRTLRWVVREMGEELLGQVPLAGQGQFPMLIKFLDAKVDLSIQVHPDARYCADHPGAHLKTEAWYILQADPGARLLKGLKAGTTREGFREAIEKGKVEECIQVIPVKAGQCYFLPSGTVHALGSGILAAEVQTPSDSTFRVYDFDRVDPSTGKKRKLHVEQALECIDFSGAPQANQVRSHSGSFFTTVTRLVTNPYFILEKVRFTEGIEEAIPYDQPVVWMMLEGEAEIRVGDLKESVKLARGDTVLLPAAMKNPILKTLKDCVWLEVTFPSRG